MDLLCSASKSLIFHIDKCISRAFAPRCVLPSTVMDSARHLAHLCQNDEGKCCLGTVLTRCLKLPLSTFYMYFLAICISTLANVLFGLFAIFVHTLRILMSFLIAHFLIYLFILFIGLFIFLQCDFSFLCRQGINPFPFDGFFCNYDLKGLPHLQTHINPMYFNTNSLIILCCT